MSTFIVEGGYRLRGTIAAAGNKNEALAVIAASLLCDKKIRFTNMPHIGDVEIMLEIASALGANVSEFRNESVSLETPCIENFELPYGLAAKIRGSILFASALVARAGKAIIVQPGGDKIGRRRLDTHFHVFKSLGARVSIKQDKRKSVGTIYVVEATKGLVGSDIYLDEASVTATENALIAAAAAKGKTVIANAASEPHVRNLCWLLSSMGVRIQGIGSNVLTVYGRSSFDAVEHTIGSDHIETGSFIGLAAATRSELTITNVNPSDLKIILFQFQRLGISVEVDEEGKKLYVGSKQKLRIRNDIGGAIPKFEDGPWPAFPADLMSIIVVTATQCKGTCLVHEKMFEARLFFVDKLIGMGAQIVLCDPHRAVIVGPTRLMSDVIVSPDIRAGMAMLIAALAAEGRSIISNCEQIDRGYQQIDSRLKALNARIHRTPERRRPAS